MYGDGAYAETAYAESPGVIVFVPEELGEEGPLTNPIAIIVIEIGVILPAPVVVVPPSPVANPDTFAVTEGVTIDLDVLGNDTSLSNRTIALPSQPSRGTASIINNSTVNAKIRWIDNGSGSGSTSFTYSVDGSASTTVSLTITGLAIPTFQQIGTQDQKGNPANDVLPSWPSTGILAGDQFLAHIVVHADSGQACATPIGWTLVTQHVTTGLAAFLFTRTATGGETGQQPFNWDGTGGVAPVALAAIYRIRAGQTTALSLGTPVIASGTGQTAMFPSVPMGGSNRRALAFLALNGRGTVTSHPTGETGGDWQFRAGASTTTGDDALTVLYDAAMAAGGTIAGGTVTQNAGDQWNLICLPAFDGTTVGKFISPTGNDTTGNGTIGNPWQTLAKGMAEVNAGERLVLRGGTYRLSSAFTWTKSGTAASRVTVASHTAETAIIDANLATFQTTGSGAWTLFDAATETYRTTTTGFSGSYTISIEISGRWYRLLNYQTRTMLMQTFYQWRYPEEFYAGPGFHVDADGRIYIRIQNLASEGSPPRDAGVPPDAPANAAVRNTPPSASGFNPNNYIIHASPILDMFTVAASNVTFERIAFHGGDRGPHQTSRTSITYDHCRMFGQRINVRWPGCSDVQVLNCLFDNGVPPWIAWNEVKQDQLRFPGLELAVSTFSAAEPGIDNALVQDCHVISCFDFIATVRTNSTNTRIVHNTIDFVFDDTPQFTYGAIGLEVAYNVIKGGGPGYNGGESDPTASKWFHHNIIDTRRDEFGWRIGWNPAGAGVAWRRSHIAFPRHASQPGATPAKIYNNTILIEDNINLQGAGVSRVGTIGEGLHEVYNNIVLQYDDREYTRTVSVGENNQILDYNIMHKVNGGTFRLFNEWPDATGSATTNYVTLADWRASAGFTFSKTVYAPGFEANSIQGDPQLGNPDAGDYRPSTTGIAASGAKPLLSTGWPGATNAPYFGAVDPFASTGLGDVGHRGTAGP